MHMFLLPAASKTGEQLTGKRALWDDLIWSPARFQHVLWSLEAAFYPIAYTAFYPIDHKNELITEAFIRETIKSCQVW